MKIKDIFLMFACVKSLQLCVAVAFLGGRVFFPGHLDAAPIKKKTARVPVNIVSSFSGVLQALKKERNPSEILVCIDVDHALVQHPYLGSPAWAEQRFRHHVQSSLSEEKSQERVEEELVAVDTFKMRKCVEVSLPEAFAGLASSSCKLLGVSSCKARAALALAETLALQGMDFVSGSPFYTDVFLRGSAPSATPFVYRGILFCCGLSLGGTLLELFAHEGVWPQKVIFVSDNPDLLKAIGHACMKQGMDFLGLVYYPATENMFSYMPPYSSAAELQERQALTLLSEEIALKALSL